MTFSQQLRAHHCSMSAAVTLSLVSVTIRNCFLDLCFHGLEVEARALLHRRKVDRRLAELGHFLLHEHTTPELIHVPVYVCDRLVETRALVGVEPQVGDDRPIDLHRLDQTSRWADR